MSRMAPSFFLDSFQVRKQDIFMINPSHFW